ncbi:uncharacterized protein EKO05_0007539 [Ascochyta rabiei]|uniref:Uncharacterized protein n=1 Tax=Didymella rabiei TaxID=5454 RepID=A0A162YI26_DIDRA|nr:uncharacterized protein EKO05_0007539 [Ascochyta rabiei]KZM20055.1 hypothetical protein ST47_g8796 [Ascochyta rabiei]UPX17166.1 hypothetical protein EKO05_0007539 [Ascochyta rabiei]
MDAPRSPSTSRSRRSYPNLHNLSLAPLSSKYPLDASVPSTPDEDVSGTRTPRTSYIAQKSAPTTPGILSLSQSRSASRNGRRSKAYAYDSYFMSERSDVRDAGDIPKAKSTNTLHPGVSFAEPTGPLEHKKHHTRKHTAPLPLRMPLHRHHTSESNDDWLHRAGLAIAGETRDARGQGWLVRRESSTSLVGQSNDFEHHASHDARHKALLSGEHMPDTNQGDYPTFSPRMSRAGSRLQSRIGSRVPSARQSRRGSRVGSRIDLAMSGLPSSSARHSLDTDGDEAPIEPDFVEADEDEGPDDEEEVARLARERGFGLGGWMDALIGWTLFSVDEDGEVSSDEEEDGGAEHAPSLTRDEAKLMREVEAKRRKMERESIVAASALSVHDQAGDEGGEVKMDVPKPPEGQEAGGWQDAAWLLSVASKALF